MSEPRDSTAAGQTILLLSLTLAACSAQSPASPAVATIQELMQAEVDASADNIWDAVETTISKSGEETKQPRTPEEWLEVRRNAIVLIEAANLLTTEPRKLAARPFPAEAAGALDSADIERRIAGNRAAFNQYAVTLRRTAQTLLTAIDARDAQALVTAGGVLDEVCESCHMTFWYPDQVIPMFPTHPMPLSQHSSGSPAARETLRQRSPREPSR